MKEFNLRYYPPPLLAFLFCLIIAINFLVKKFVANINGHHFTIWQEMVILLFSGGLVTTIVRFVNKNVMWSWLLKLLGIYDVRGKYSGELTSSYYKDDDPEKDQLKKYIEFNIAQNLNGIHISGKIFNHFTDTNPTSEFESEQTEIRKQEDGNFSLTYRYLNKPDLLHTEHRSYGLNMHEGFAILKFNPGSRKLEGIYFNYERSSHGRLELAPKP